MSSCSTRKKIKKGKSIKQEKKNVINIALAGNPNVGKSVIFNQLTGLSQTIGNWPGKTVEKMEGHLDFLNYRFNIVDLPGIYSLSTYSLEEIISRKYIVSENVDAIINVIDATNLERNLFLTYQLLELRVPVILGINQMDILHKRNLDIDFKRMEEIFKLPVVPLVAVHGVGVHQLLEKVIEIHKKYHQDVMKDVKLKGELNKSELINDIESKSEDMDLKRISIKQFFKFPDLHQILSFGKEIEEKIQSLRELIEKNRNIIKELPYPSRFISIKLLENDEEIVDFFKSKEGLIEILEKVEQYRKELEDFHGEDINTIISSEIYNNIRKIVDQVLIPKSKTKKKGNTLPDLIDHLTTHSILGYFILTLVIFGIYTFTFNIGDFIGSLIDDAFSIWTNQIHSEFGSDNLLIEIFWDGAMGGFIGAISGVLVYVAPFFLTIEILQDSGYLPRAAFLMDKIMHIMGVHGKTIITMILGFGCNVPACAGCRIMETEREKKISMALTSLIPCAATMTVVLGLVGRYLGLYWLMVLFVINFVVILIVGRILNKLLPGECTELIMEMHEYRKPNVKVILKQTWLRTKEFVYKALPIIVILGFFLEVLLILNALAPLNFVLTPITVYWLGLPAVTGIFLIYGILRKELTLVLLSIFAQNLGLTVAQLLTPAQMIIFSLVTMLYIPCLATIIIIAKLSSWKYALQISLLEISLAILIGGFLHFIFIIFSFI